MKEIRFELKWEELSVQELSETESRLMGDAIQAADRAYAPYSRFHVGVALLLANGEIITGNNQENAAYPSGLCAERVALFYAGAQYPDVPVQLMAVVASVNGKIQPQISPCGSCRQVLLETEHRGKQPIRILLCGKDKVRIVSSATDLLPLSFSMD